MVTTGEVPQGIVLRPDNVIGRERRNEHTVFGAPPGSRQKRLPMTIRDGGDPSRKHGPETVVRWARRLGASPPKRMAASWSGSDAGPTEYKVAARCYAPKMAGSPRFVLRPWHTKIPFPSEEARENQLDIESPYKFRPC